MWECVFSLAMAGCFGESDNSVRTHSDSCFCIMKMSGGSSGGRLEVAYTHSYFKFLTIAWKMQNIVSTSQTFYYVSSSFVS